VENRNLVLLHLFNYSFVTRTCLFLSTDNASLFLLVLDEGIHDLILVHH
jgi:hypothetical protein